MKGIADTGFLVAFLNRRDTYHDWAVELAQRVTEPLLTCEAVLAEATFHIKDPVHVLSLVQDGLVRPALEMMPQLSRLLEIAARFADQKPDLADLCLIRLSELYPKYNVITVDVKDFRVYRRNRNEVIPLLIPPNSHSRR